MGFVMKELIIVGAGSFGREVAQLVEDINLVNKEWILLGFIDETKEKQGTLINNIPVLGGFDWLEKNNKGSIYTAVAIGNPVDKYNLIKKVSLYDVDFCNLIHPEAKISRFVEMGTGCIICWNSFLSVNTRLGDHVSINPGCGIGHDTVIGHYSTLYWNVTLSGNVNLKDGCEVGANSVVIPKKTVGKWSIIGAGAAVVEDLPENCTAVGVPAKPIKYSDNRPY